MSYSEVICEQNREEVIFYTELGSYQGEWILFSKKGDQYFFRQGGYGSCNYCDSYQACFNYDEPIIDSKKTIEFVNGYQPKKIFTYEELKEYKDKNNLLYGFIPFDTGWYHDENYDKAIIKLLNEILINNNYYDNDFDN